MANRTLAPLLPLFALVFLALACQVDCGYHLIGGHTSPTRGAHSATSSSAKSSALSKSGSKGGTKSPERQSSFSKMVRSVSSSFMKMMGKEAPKDTENKSPKKAAHQSPKAKESSPKKAAVGEGPNSLEMYTDEKKALNRHRMAEEEYVKQTGGERAVQVPVFRVGEAPEEDFELAKVAPASGHKFGVFGRAPSAEEDERLFAAPPQHGKFPLFGRDRSADEPEEGEIGAQRAEAGRQFGGGPNGGENHQTADSFEFSRQ